VAKYLDVNMRACCSMFATTLNNEFMNNNKGVEIRDQMPRNHGTTRK
jgi:hypothetical protein